MEILNRPSSLILALLMLTAFNAKSQIATAVTETAETIGDVSGSAMHVRIHRASKKEILKAVKSKLKERSEEVKSKGDEVYASQVLFPNISEHEIKVYAKVKEFSNTEHELYLIFLNGDQIISSDNDMTDYNSAKAYLYEFANRLSRESNQEFHSNAEKELKSMEGRLQNLRNEKERDEANVIKQSKKIKSNEGDIKKLDDKKNLDEKAIKDRANKEKDILKSKQKIKELEYNLKQNKKDQDELIERIKTQRETIEVSKKHIELFD